jgi:hypothetical protein
MSSSYGHWAEPDALEGKKSRQASSGTSAEKARAHHTLERNSGRRARLPRFVQIATQLNVEVFRPCQVAIRSL